MEDSTVTRAYLADVVYRKMGYSRSECADLVDAVIEEIISGLEKQGVVKLSSFGSFRMRQKKERIGRNPKTKEEVPIPPRKVISFYASALMKKRINSGGA